MSGSSWDERSAPLINLLENAQPTAPVLSSREALMGNYHGEGVWLLKHKELKLSVAVSLGDHPLEGHLCTADNADAGGANLTGDPAFDQKYAVSRIPREVAVLALQDPAAREAVVRSFRNMGGYPLTFRSGFLEVSAQFYRPSPLGIGVGPRRPPSPEEAHTLIASLVFLAQRFRWAYQTVLTQMAQGGAAPAPPRDLAAPAAPHYQPAPNAGSPVAQHSGPAAAAEWDRALRVEQAGSQQRRRVFKTLFLVAVIGLVVLMFSTVLFAVVFMNRVFG